MISRFIKNIVNRFGAWRTVQAILVVCAVTLFTTAVLRSFVPIHISRTDSQANTLSEFTASENISTLPGENKDKQREAIAYRPGMFRPTTGLGDKPLADRTIERIKDQLKLQCVMEMNGQPVAYINIQGVGLKKCCVGDNINDLFTVLDINKQNKSVEISIVEHKVTLHL
ncbi:MAG: hypothetical protein ACYTFK_08985 [Planctomycetota bacterium]|jgi:hypothetical protein